MKVSIIIVSYNAKDHLQFCLESCEKAIEHLEAEIIVIDNCSTNQELKSLNKLFPKVQFHFLDKNIGFAKANNYGVAKAKGEFILILNPDTIIPEDLFDGLIKFYLQKENIGLLGVRLIDANGNFHPESKRNLPTPLNSFSKLFKIGTSSTNTYYKVDIEPEETGMTSILVGAFMFTKKGIYNKVGGFDTRYFMYGEDIDLSYSVELAGYTNYYKGDQIVLHYKGESTKKDRKYYEIFFEAMNLFIEKYYKDNWLKLNFMKLGIAFKYYSFILNLLFIKSNIGEKRVQKNELYWLKESLELSTIKEKHIVLSTEFFSFKEILRIIAQNNSPQIFFYIHSHISNKILGYKGLIK